MRGKSFNGSAKASNKVQLPREAVTKGNAVNSTVAVGDTTPSTSAGSPLVSRKMTESSQALATPVLAEFMEVFWSIELDGMRTGNRAQRLNSKWLDDMSLFWDQNDLAAMKSTSRSTYLAIESYYAKNAKQLVSFAANFKQIQVELSHLYQTSALRSLTLGVVPNELVVNMAALTRRYDVMISAFNSLSNSSANKVVNHNWNLIPACHQLGLLLSASDVRKHGAGIVQSLMKGYDTQVLPFHMLSLLAGNNKRMSKKNKAALTRDIMTTYNLVKVSVTSSKLAIEDIKCASSSNLRQRVSARKNKLDARDPRVPLNHISSGFETGSIRVRSNFQPMDLIMFALIVIVFCVSLLKR